jgi:hypothetical protein
MEAMRLPDGSPEGHERQEKTLVQLNGSNKTANIVRLNGIIICVLPLADTLA